MKHHSSIFIISGLFLIVLSVTVLVAIFFPVIKIEINYLIHRPPKDAQVVRASEKSSSSKTIISIDENFGLVIPKIGANAKIIANVDPYNEAVYQRALTRGIAHALGTSFPNQTGNMFLFSHSSVNFFEAVHYNSVFYLLSKLEKDDDIYIFYQKEKYHYKVTEKRVARGEEIAYLGNLSQEKYLTLMTCTPPGTTLKRLLVIAQAVN